MSPASCPGASEAMRRTLDIWGIFSLDLAPLPGLGHTQDSTLLLTLLLHTFCL